MRSAAGVAVVLGLAAAASGQLRVGTWNLTFYAGEPSRDDDFAIALFDQFEGRSFRPDVLVVQEVLGEAAADAFLALLDAADPRGPGWARAPYVDGPDTDSALFYRVSLADALSVTVVSAGGPSPRPPRNTLRYDLAVEGYDQPRLAIYSTHMKSGSGAADRDRRLREAQAIRADARTLPDGWHVVVAGDLNMRTSSEVAYRELVESRGDNRGRVFDPVSSPGSWNDSTLFRFLHSQDPVSSMDDRFDQLLLNDDLLDGDGLDYLGDPSTPISRTTFADPNHSYRTWGNDGTSFDLPLARDNAMVGPVIARALTLAPDSSLGHLPVFLDLLVPAKVGSLTTLDFGRVQAGAQPTLDLPVGNAGDVARWTAGGVQPLRYRLEADAGVIAPAGEFEELAGGGLDLQPIGVDTSIPGPIEAELRIVSNDPDQPVRTVRVLAEVLAPPCEADLDGDGELTLFDFLAFQNLFDAGDPAADFDGDGELTLFDFLAFQNAFDAGCP